MSEISRGGWQPFYSAKVQCCGTMVNFLFTSFGLISEGLCMQVKSFEGNGDGEVGNLVLRRYALILNDYEFQISFFFC